MAGMRICAQQQVAKLVCDHMAQKMSQIQIPVCRANFDALIEDRCEGSEILRRGLHCDTQDFIAKVEILVVRSREQA